MIDLTKNDEPRSGSSDREFDLKTPSFEEYLDSRNEADQDRETTNAKLPSPRKVDSRNQKGTSDGKLMQQVKKRHTLEIQKIHEENVKLTARLRQEQEERAQAMQSEKEDTIRKLKEEKEGIIQALRNENEEAKRHENEARVKSTLLDDLMSKSSQLKQEIFVLRNQLSVQPANTEDRICKSLSEEKERNHCLQRKLDNQESSVASLKLELEKAKSDLSKITQQARLKPELLPPSPLSIAGSNKRSFSVAPAIGTSHSLEEKSDNIRRVFLRVKRKYDTVHSLVSKLVTDTRGLNLSLFGEFGQHIGSLRKLLEEEAKERIMESEEQQESVERTNGSV
ncbi:hypothetical protein BS50DRAFT_638268 [Corynespora cassiicola Philippines]|uniref:Uncharacterized protein n=1 Tax=Corynespora cassiicola Philippines TaxID=1448308 RepID=A0A2T2NB55_CORCC|nr:hypothetical protein BS50DRAFT_638268 [Corynespora cassiicola Philippines]